jgi:signal transduction histidine kinase
MSPAAVAAPAFADTWRRETHRFVASVFKGRFVLLPIVGLVFGAYLLWDPVPWKLVWIAVTLLVMATISIVEHLRLQRSLTGPGTIVLNLLVMLLMQTAMIYVTGGIESPLIVIYLPLGIIIGLTVGRPRPAFTLIAVPVTGTLFLAAGAAGHFLPRATPAFLGIGAGFADSPVYVWVKALLVALLMIVTGVIGIGIRRAYEGVLRAVADARRETLETLASRNREIESVASTVAHELKNPLASIQGLTQLLGRGAAPGGKDRERLDVMLREIGRMGTVLDEFRSFTRPLSGLRLAATDLGRLIEDVVLLGEGAAGTRHIGFRAPPSACSITCDPQKVKQALLNLVQNGVDASPAGATVEIRTSLRDGRWAEIAVLDAGPGVAPELAARLFTPGLTTKAHGSGIGLVVARSIAEQHGGRLDLANRPAGGCVATLTLPLEAAAPAAELPA